GAPALSAPSLVDAGRRLLRCWATITAAGYAYHPISVAVDRPETAPEVAAVAGVAVPVAVFRVGRPTRPAPESNRRPLYQVLRPASSPRRAAVPGAGLASSTSTAARAAQALARPQ